MNPSQTELVILKHLWATGSQSVCEIHDAVSPILGRSRSSTRKTLARMLEKELKELELHLAKLNAEERANQAQDSEAQDD